MYFVKQTLYDNFNLVYKIYTIHMLLTHDWHAKTFLFIYCLLWLLTQTTSFFVKFVLDNCINDCFNLNFFTFYANF